MHEQRQLASQVRIRKRSNAIASQLVLHDHPRNLLQTLRQPLEETLGGFGIAAFLNGDVEHSTVLIHGGPKIMLHSFDPDEDLV
jgi:hypothetical protein